MESSYYDLQGIWSVESHTHQSAETLLRWKTRYGMPMIKLCDNESFFWAANSKELNEWLNETGTTWREISDKILQRKALFCDIKAGTRPPLHNKKSMCRSAAEIASTFRIPLNTALDLCRNFVDFPVNGKSFEITANCLQDWFDLNGFPVGMNQDGCPKERTF